MWKIHVHRIILPMLSLVSILIIFSLVFIKLYALIYILPLSVIFNPSDFNIYHYKEILNLIFDKFNCWLFLPFLSVSFKYTVYKHWNSLMQTMSTNWNRENCSTRFLIFKWNFNKRWMNIVINHMNPLNTSHKILILVAYKNITI